MKLLRLDLRAFGPFTNVALDFPDDGAGLHLIHGPNEAGKSSALRALRGFFFGFPPRTTDNHLHKYPDLRVGATIVGADGSTLACLRRKTNTKSLRGPDDEAVIDDRVLNTWLGGQNEARFCSVFMSNLAELIKGGLDLITGKGDFGEILFGASGLSRLPEVRKLLESDADLLFKKGATAKNPRINATLLNLDAARKVAREAMLSSGDWAATDRDHKEALARLVAIREESDRAETEHRRLERLGRVLPLLADRREALAQLEAIGEVASLSEGFAERRLNAVAARAANAETAKISRAAMEAIEAELASIVVPVRLLDEAKAIGLLREELGGLRKARDRRPRLLDQAAQAETAARATLRELAPGRSLDDVESLRLGKAQKAAIQALDRDRGTIEAEVAKAREAVIAVSSQLADHPLFHGADVSRRLDNLAAIVTRIGRSVDPQSARDLAVAEVRRVETEAKVELARLPRWSATLDELAARPVPVDATIAHLEASIVKAEAAVEASGREIRSNATEISALDEQAAQERVGGDPPTEADLARSRGDRDESWREVRHAWIEGKADRPPPEIAISYEHRVGSADMLSDALRREADRVASHAAREGRRKRLVEASETLAEASRQALVNLGRCQADWQAAWRSAGVEPGPPAEMRGWSAQYRNLLVRAAAIRSARLDVDRATESLDATRTEIDAALHGLGEPPALESDSLAALLGRARSAIDRGERTRALEAAKTRRDEAEARLADWRTRWAGSIGPLGLGPDASPELALDVIERLDALFSGLKEAQRKRAEVEEIDRDLARHEQDVTRLARQVGFDTVEPTTEALVTALAEAERSRDRRNSALSRLSTEQKRIKAAESTIRSQDALLTVLCQEAGCDSPDDLPAIERRAAEARAWHDRVVEDDRQILALGAGATLSEIAREVDGLDPDTIPTRLRDFAERIETLQTRGGELHEEVGELRARLAAMNGGAAASDANELARQWLAGIEADVEQYARLKLASAVLRKAIERYRDRHQGPILARLGRLFAHLTAGSFAGVILEEDETNPSGQGVLKGLRPGPNGEQVLVEGMSEGTADALYLAVRLATLETYLDTNEPMPFIVDDILVHFDDARASAALQVMRELSKKTQVLFFTHHRHLIDLAEKGLPPMSWKLHELPGRTDLGKGHKVMEAQAKERKSEDGSEMAIPLL